MKEEVRKKYLDIRNNIKNKTFLDKQIYHSVINNLSIINSELVLIYVSFGNEVNTLNLIKYFLSSKQVAVPKIINNEMNFYYIKSLTELKKGKYSILEPITNNKVTSYKSCVSITPGICFSRSFYRIGYGKGYYDRFYEKYSDIYKIGLTYDECVIDNIPIDNYDIALDEIITPSKNIKKGI